jgi:hypothetical protein
MKGAPPKLIPITSFKHPSLNNPSRRKDHPVAVVVGLVSALIVQVTSNPSLLVLAPDKTRSMLESLSFRGEHAKGVVQQLLLGEIKARELDQAADEEEAKQQYENELEQTARIMGKKTRKGAKPKRRQITTGSR